MLYFSHFFTLKSAKSEGFTFKSLVSLRKMGGQYKDVGVIIPQHL